ncbi:MAG: Txe/YoeB family addiction module toxin [Lactobacillaceae bacterium]|jgi:toxin YoeB|nr:Txe/YoeB family addiction module toxin [Lactobacillaceae bacterium]
MALNVKFSPSAWSDFEYWTKQDRKTLKQIFKLINNTSKTPFEELGKPEPLKNEEGAWSRRIDDYNRLVYRVTENEIQIVSVRYHYEN